MQRGGLNEDHSGQDKFKEALSSVLAVKPGDPRLAEAKDEPASPNTRYKYDPEADRS